MEVEYALRTKANLIAAAAYTLQSKLPGEFKGRLPTAKQLADLVRVERRVGNEKTVTQAEPVTLICDPSMLFFKYQKPGLLEFNMLRKGEIFFASPSELNDPNECRPRYILKGSEDLWQRLAKFILQNVVFHSEQFSSRGQEALSKLLSVSDQIGTQLKLAVSNRDLGLEELAELFINILAPLVPIEKTFDSVHLARLAKEFINSKLPIIAAEDRYISSFSLSATNPTMWGHYAGAEKGFVIIYQTEDNTIHVRSPIRVLDGCRPLNESGDHMEIGTYDNDCLQLHRIRYGVRPPTVNLFHRMIHRFSYSEQEDHFDVPAIIMGDAAPKEEELIGLVKYSGWRYEQELRAFFPFHGTALPDIRVLSAAKSVKGLIFGPRMSEEDRARSVLCCHIMKKSLGSLADPADDFEPLVFFEARLLVNRFGFDVTPLGVLAEHFSKHGLPFTPVSETNPAVQEVVMKMAKQIADGD
ncbi:Protein of unknown function [Prosthecobacter debontii]|uniref:DUF2971 domain-containing protein n=1 Tax=Prosthecobacter debontii TaxID=48467 RepID=A0A1T4WLC4_9BACT|nr:Protein of unknown function [Prosthecobacter debontii]